MLENTINKIKDKQQCWKTICNIHDRRKRTNILKILHEHVNEKKNKQVLQFKKMGKELEVNNHKE